MQDDERDPHDAPAEPPPDDRADEASPAPAAEDVGPPLGELEAWVAPQPDATPGSASMPAHSVPATPLGEGTPCPRCGTDNRPGIAFCRSCGQRLVAPAAAVERPATPEGTAACPRCGTHNRAGVAFCQNCGANLRPADAGSQAPMAVPQPKVAARAILGPIVLLIGAAGMLTAWLLPFTFGGASLWDRSFGAPGGYGVAFWSAYPASGRLVETSYFGLAAPIPILLVLLVALAGAGFLRAAPGLVQRIALAVTLAWGLGLAAMFVVVELLGGPGGDLVGVLRALSPAGIIFLLAGLIVAIGSATRLWRA